MKIILHIENSDPIPFALVSEIGNSLAEEMIIFANDLMNEAIFSEPSDTSLPIAASEFLDDLKQHKGEVIRIESATTGSVILVLIALGEWILDKTIGESLKNIWLESEYHRRLKQIFAKQTVPEMTGPRIESAIQRGIENAKRISPSLQLVEWQMDQNINETWVKISPHGTGRTTLQNHNYDE